MTSRCCYHGCEKRCSQSRNMVAMSRPIRRSRPCRSSVFFGASLCGLSLVVGMGCNAVTDKLPLGPIPLVLDNGLLYARGHIQPTRDDRCGVQPEEGAPPGSGFDALLIDTATPLTTLVPQVADTPRQFPSGQLGLSAALSGGGSGATQLLRCDVPVVRSDLSVQDFWLRWGGSPKLALGGVLGGDQLLNYSLELRFSPGGATAQFARGDLATWCRIDRAVIPFKALGGELAVQLADTVIQYPPTRVTVGACLEPYSDPLTGPTPSPCIDDAKVDAALRRVVLEITEAEKAMARDEDLLARLADQESLLRQLQAGQCSDDESRQLGDLADDRKLRQPPYEVSGTNMRFLVSTAVPELLLTETACKRLGNKRCSCEDAPADQVMIELPGLNVRKQQDGTVVALPDRGCRIRLGDAQRAALALVAKQRQLSPCDELARSRRQRWAMQPASPTATAQQLCHRSVCLRNLGRDPALLGRRCGYTGLDADLACNDKLSPVAATVELGGPRGPGNIDTLVAVVVPDSAALIQSANADLRNLSAQIDGVIGVSVLQRMYTTIDYPQGRLELLCRCGDPMAASSPVCHAYRGITYYTADSCVQSDTLTVPADLARLRCDG